MKVIIEDPNAKKPSLFDRLPKDIINVILGELDPASDIMYRIFAGLPIELTRLNQTANLANDKQHLDIVKWAIEHKLPIQDGSCIVESAIEFNRLDILQILDSSFVRKFFGRINEYIRDPDCVLYRGDLTNKYPIIKWAFSKKLINCPILYQMIPQVTDDDIDVFGWILEKIKECITVAALFYTDYLPGISEYLVKTEKTLLIQYMLEKEPKSVIQTYRSAIQHRKKNVLELLLDLKLCTKDDILHGNDPVLEGYGRTTSFRWITKKETRTAERWVIENFNG